MRFIAKLLGLTRPKKVRMDASGPYERTVYTYIPGPVSGLAVGDEAYARVEPRDYVITSAATGYSLNTAEDRAERHVLTSMADCDELLNGFLTFNGREVLKGLGTRTKSTADKIARERFAEFQRIQDAEWQNDFEKIARRLEER